MFEGISGMRHSTQRLGKLKGIKLKKVQDHGSVLIARGPYEGLFQDSFQWAQKPKNSEAVAHKFQVCLATALADGRPWYHPHGACSVEIQDIGVAGSQRL